MVPPMTWIIRPSRHLIDRCLACGVLQRAGLPVIDLAGIDADLLCFRCARQPADAIRALLAERATDLSNESRRLRSLAKTLAPPPWSDVETALRRRNLPP